jgi:2-polyprenyl-3-methyl-5-hydroxy-6-metoxy-1,4-benzoquinol methylase
MGRETGAAGPDFDALAVRLGGFKSPERVRFRCRETFRRLPLAGRRLLEIGAGAGIFSAYAITQGAAHVVALEPETAGSTEGSVGKIHQMQDALGAANLEVSAATIQTYDSGGRLFDIILCHNSVNHLDEPSCTALGESEEARESYRGIFRKLAGMMSPGGLLVLADVSRHNLYPMIGLRNPIAPNIEWHKHQAPATWARLLEPLGFRKHMLSWYRYHPLRWLGPLAANRVANFFLTSHFRLVMRYEGRPHG